MNLAGALGEPKTIRISHVNNSGLLNLLLYGFAIAQFEANGNPTDQQIPANTLQYAVVVNMPVDLQVEAVISFISDFLNRREYLKGLRVSGDTQAIQDLDRVIHRVDASSRELVIDDLRSGWELAAEGLALRAGESGLKLHVAYETTLLDRDQIVSRMPLMRRIYNTFPTVRRAIDITVGLLAGREPQVVARGGSEATRALFQQYTAVSSLTKFLNHAARDAFVCGNGYLAARPGEPFSFYTVRPEDVYVLGPNRFARKVDDQLEEAHDIVLHLRGMDQFESPYGISMLEVFGGSIAQYDTFERAANFAQKTLESSSVEAQRMWAARVLEQRDRIASDREENFNEVLAAPLETGSDPIEDLYFEGYEQFPTDQ